MADEKLRLQAEVRDNMSPALRKIKDTLNSIRATPSMKAATTEMKNLGAATAKFAGFGGSAATALGAMGIGGLATAGSLAAVVAQMRELGQRSLDMKELGRETGVSINWLNAWSHAGLNFGVSADSMSGAVDTLAAKMPQFRKHMGDLYRFTTANAANFPGLTNALEGENLEQQTKTIMRYADRIRDPQLQKQFLGEFFGNGDDIERLFRNGAKGFFDEFQRMQKALNPINPDLLKQSQEFRESITAFNVALDNFENSAGPTFLKEMKGVVEEAKAVTDVLNAPLDPKSWLNAARDIWRNSALGAVGGLEDRAVDAAANKIEGKPDTPPQKFVPPPVRGNLFHKSSFDGDDAGLFHRTAFTSAATGSTFGLAGIIADGTKSGVIAAFREMMATNEAANGNASAGFQQASYDPDSPAVAAGRRIGRAEREDGGAARSAGRNIGKLDGSTNYHDPNDFYDAIIQAEGTGKYGSPYDTSLGYTKSPVPLTKMTLGQSLEWGDWIRHNTRIGEATNSSAKGAFQIVNTTQRLAMRALHMKMSDLFSEENQRKMASWIARHQGLGAWASMPSHPGLEARAARALRAGEDLQYRRATGLASDAASGSARAAAATEGHIRADIHVHGAGVQKAIVKTKGAIEARVNRWPVTDYA